MKEVRIGMVLYGGVSLAVYMNGIVTETWHLLRASRAWQDRKRAEDPCDPGLLPDGSAGIYAALLKRMEEEGGTDLRVVVDAVAGSSAGGVNGAVLAKAVVEGGDAAVLNEVWCRDADIAKLRADPARRLAWLPRTILSGLAPLSGFLRPIVSEIDRQPGLSRGWVLNSLYNLLTTRDGRVTPLNGDYFTGMIAGTLRKMGQGKALLPDRGSFDLFLTATDLHGWPRRLAVSPAFHPTGLEERLHAHVLSFRHSPQAGAAGIGHDFDLTFAARATAGFPLAFAPLSYADVAAAWRSARQGEAAPPIDVFAKRRLREHVLAGFPPAHARMIDGGVLDNKPFSDLMRAIEEKPADRQVYRALIYVEPDPEPRVPPPPEALPTPLAVAGGLYALFRHEPIHDDLQALHARNERIDTLLAFRASALADARRIAMGLAREEGLDWPVDTARLDRWRGAVNRHVARGGIPGHDGYVSLKARAAADGLAGLCCAALDYPAGSRHATFLQALVHAWLKRRGMLSPPAEAEEGSGLPDLRLELLRGFDLSYRKRRLRFLVQAVNAHYDTALEGQAKRDWRCALDHAKAALSDIVFSYQREYADTAVIGAGLSAALAIPSDRLDAAIAEGRDDAEALAIRRDEGLEVLFRALLHRFTTHADRQNAAMFAVVDQLPEPARTDVATVLVCFPVLDIVLYPLMEGSGIGDLAKVAVLRISPSDAVLASDNADRLEGRRWEGFYGFLDPAARESDLLWGRLDGAERLIQLLTTAASTGTGHCGRFQELAREFTRLAHLAILEAEEGRENCLVRDRIAEIRRGLS